MRIQWTKQFILRISEQGLLYFKKRFNLTPLNEFQFENVDSEFHDEKGTLSLFLNKSKLVWFFKDWGGQEYYGDVFSYVGFLLKLDIRKDFRKILKHIYETIYGDNKSVNDQDFRIENEETGEFINVLPENEATESSKNNFYNCFPSLQLYSPVKVITSFAIAKDDYKIERYALNKKINSSNHYFGLQNGSSAYLIIDTSTLKVWQWGKKYESFVFGLREAIQINFFQSPNAKENLVVCDSLVNTLSLLSVGIAAIYLPSSGLKTTYFVEIIASSFKNIILCYEKVTNNIIKGTIGTEQKIFGLKDFLEMRRCASLKEYVTTQSQEDYFFQELFDLFHYIEDDIEVDESFVK